MWKKPDRGADKINGDASFCAEKLSGATGAIARDDRGDFIAEANWFIPHVSNVDAAEIIAVRNGMILAERIGCNSLIIESDSTFQWKPLINKKHIFVLRRLSSWSVSKCSWNLQRLPLCIVFVKRMR